MGTLNDVHILHLRSETVVVRRRMNRDWIINDGHNMVPGDECDLKFLTFVLQLKENPRNKTSTRKFIRPVMVLGHTGWQAAMSGSPGDVSEEPMR